MNKGFWYLLSALSISTLGDTFGMLALEWMIYEMTNSKLAMGTLALCFGLSEFVCRLVGSPLIDRYDRRNLLTLLDIIRCLALVFPISMGIFGQLELWHLYVAAVLIGSCTALFAPATMALIAELVQQEGLVRAYSLLEGCKNGAYLIGPAFAGALIAIFGSFPALIINAVCFALSAGFIVCVPRIQKGHKFNIHAKAINLVGYIREIQAGFIFFKQFPAMLIIMILVSISNMSSIAIWTMMVPFVQDHLQKDATAMGTLSTAAALGTIFGLSILSLFAVKIKKRRFFMLGSLIVIGILMSTLGLTTNYYLAILLIFLSGIAAPFFGSFSSALYGSLVPANSRGRVMSVRYLVGGSLQPIGGFAGGIFAQSFGIPILFIVGGLLPALCSLAGLFIPQLKDLDGDLEKHIKKSGS